MNQPATLTTTYTIALADGSELTVAAEKLIVVDAALVALVGGRAVLILAHEQWHRCDAAPVPSEQPGWGGPARLCLQAEDVP